jgi:hypothetical protein
MNLLNRAIKFCVWAACCGLFLADGTRVRASSAPAGSESSFCFVEKQYSSGGQSPESVALGDFTGDGFLDIAVANFGNPFSDALIGGNIVTILFNFGDGRFYHFAPASTQFVGAGPRSLVSGDWDRDGYTDLAVGSQNSTDITLMLNSGATKLGAPGIFDTLVALPAAGDQLSLVAAEVDGKPGLDLAASGFLSGVSMLFQRAIPHSFGGPYSTAAGQGSRIAVGDLDGDGDADVVVANQVSSDVVWLRNYGKGQLKKAGQMPLDGIPLGIALADVDQNGALDAIVANSPVDHLSVFRNLGNGVFGSPDVYAVGGSTPETYAQTPGAIVASDYDGDGLVDLAVANMNGSKVSLFRNGAEGYFVGPILLEVGPNPTALVGGDLDGDGDTDLVSANASSHSISVLLNCGN